MAVIKNDNTLPPGLTKQTAEVFNEISRLECIKGLYLCGGTAQAIQMDHRLSEDLDFELIGTTKSRPELDFGKIINEVSARFPDSKQEILGDDHFLIYLNENKVKLSFYRPENPVKHINKGYKHNNILTPSLQDLLGMKLYTICVRTKTRDYYDIYCLLEAGCDLKQGISYASYLSRHNFKSKDMMTKLITPQLYPINDDFLKMQPRYPVTSEQIKERMIEAIKQTKTKRIPKGLSL